MKQKAKNFFIFFLGLFPLSFQGHSSYFQLPEGLTFEKDEYHYAKGKKKEDFSPEIQHQIRLHEILKKLEAQAVGDNKALISEINPKPYATYETFFEVPKDPLYQALKKAQMGHYIVETAAELQKEKMIKSHYEAALLHLSEADLYLNRTLNDTRPVTSTLEELFKGIASQTKLQRKSFNPPALRIEEWEDGKDESRIHFYPLDPLYVFGVRPDGKCGHYAVLNKTCDETVEQLMRKKESRSTIQEILKDMEEHKYRYEKDVLTANDFNKIQKELTTNQNTDLTLEETQQVENLLKHFFAETWMNNSIMAGVCKARKEKFLNWFIAKDVKNKFMYEPAEGLNELIEPGGEKIKIIHSFHYRSPPRHFSALVEEKNWQHMILRKIHEREHQLFYRKTSENEKKAYEVYVKQWIQPSPLFAF